MRGGTMVDGERSMGGALRLAPVRPEAWRPNAPLRAAYVMSWIAAALMVTASLLGLFVEGLYREGTAWAREAFRGGDLVTLVVAVPLLVGSLILVRRGSARARVVWTAMLVYVLYDFGYYVFGASFNDAFAIHIALLSLGIYGLACALPQLDVVGTGERLRNDAVARWVGVVLVVVGAGQGALWLFLLVRYVATGELLHDIPVAGQHLVFAMDLAVLMPALVVSGVLLFRRRAAGFFFGAAMAVMGAVYCLNGLVAAVFQSRADVPGVKAFSPDQIVLVLSMLIPAIVLLRGARRTDALDSR